MKKKLILLYALLLGLVLCGFSQDTSKIHLLEEVRVTGLSIHTTKSSSNLNPQKENSNAQETPSYLSKLPSVTWQSDNGTPFGYSYLRIRGLDQQRISYSLNGVPLNDGEDMGAYTSNVTDLMSSLKDIRVLRGGGGSRSGSPLYAGSIEMELAPPDSTETRFEVGGGSFGSYRTSLTTQNSHYRFQGSITGSDGWRDHSWGRSSSYVLSTNVLYKGWLIRFNSLGGFTRNAQSWLPVPEGMNKKTNLLSASEVDHFIETINQIQAVRNIGSSTLILSPYWIHLDGNYLYSIDPTTLGKLSLKWDNIGGYFALKGGNSVRYSIGGTLNFHKRDHIGSMEPQWSTPTYENFGKKQDHSVFLKLNTGKKILFESDIQLRKAKLDYQTTGFGFNVFDYNFFNWKFQTSRQFQTFKGFLSISQSYREPTRTDIFGYNDHYTTSNINELRKVNPERVIDYEVGIQAVDRNFKFNYTVFFMDFKNEILNLNQYNYLGISVRENISSSKRYGIEMEANHDISKSINLGFNATTMESLSYLPKTGTIGNMSPWKASPFSPNGILNLFLRVHSKTYLAELSLKSVSSSKMDFSEWSVNQIPSYNTLNVRIEKDWKKVSLRMSLLNLLDVPYASNGNLTYNTPGVFGEPTRNFFWQSGFSLFTSLSFKL